MMKNGKSANVFYHRHIEGGESHPMPYNRGEEFEIYAAVDGRNIEWRLQRKTMSVAQKNLPAYVIYRHYK